jgi:Family of unknown function (DUF6812)
MTWNDAFDAVAIDGPYEPIEIVGPNLRILGTISMGRFGRLTDLINASRDYLRIRDARILKRNGDLTNMVLSELLVDQDEISFIAQHDAVAPEPGASGGFVEPIFGTVAEIRKPREFVLFTPGHTVSGKVHLFGETDLAGFVDATDPRFVPVIDVTVRSLVDARISNHFDFVLINRTQMIAAAEVAGQGDVAAEEVPAEPAVAEDPEAPA